MGNKTTEEEEEESVEAKRPRPRDGRRGYTEKTIRGISFVTRGWQSARNAKRGRKRNEKKSFIYIYIYIRIYILLSSHKSVRKIGPNIKMNGLSYSHESKQKVCGTYLSCESSIRYVIVVTSTRCYVVPKAQLVVAAFTIFRSIF